MARDKSLRALASQPNNRLQVDANIGQPLVTPMNSLGGQYSVAVQDTPRTNQLLNFAKAINQAPILGQQFANISKQAGTEAALAVNNDEVIQKLKESDPDTWLTFARNKAYREVLLKRGIQQHVLPKLNDTEALKPDALQYQSEEDFLENGIEPHIRKVWSDFIANVGTDIGGSTEAQILFNTFSDAYRSEMMTAYQKSQEEVVQNQFVEEGATLADALTSGNDPLTVDVVNNEIRGLDQLGKSYNLDNKTTVTGIRSAFLGQAEQLIAGKRYRRALELVDALKESKVGKHSLFGSPDDRLKLARISSTAEDKLEVATSKSSTQNKNLYVGTITSLAGKFMQGDVSQVDLDTADTNVGFTEFRRLVDMVGSGDKTEEELVEQYNNIVMSQNKFIALDNYLGTEASQNYDEGNIYYETVTAVNGNVVNLGQRLVSIRAMGTDERTQLLSNAEFQMRNNLDERSLQDYTATLRVGNAKDREKASSLSKAFQFVTTDSWKNLNRNVSVTLNDFYQTVSASTITNNRLKGEAKTLFNKSIEYYTTNMLQKFSSQAFNGEVYELALSLQESGKSSEEINQEVQKFVVAKIDSTKRLIQAYADRYVTVSSEPEENREETLEPTKESVGVFSPFKYKKYDVLSKSTTEVTIPTLGLQQKSMLDNNDYDDFSLSLFKFKRVGFLDSNKIFDREAINRTLENTKGGLDVFDFFAYSNPENLSKHNVLMIRALNKFENQEDLTQEELEALKDMKSIGIVSEGDITNYYTVQVGIWNDLFPEQ